MYGHTTPLLVLPFDHRASFAKGLFNSEDPDPETIVKIKDYKHLIYEAIFEAQKKLDLPLDYIAILVDEAYGDEILHDARSKNIQTMQSVEKSGLPEFDFEYGEDFGTHLTEDNATFAKALVRFNPEGDSMANAHSLARLKKLSDFCHQNGIKLLIEPLVPATEKELASVNNDVARYDTELRPALTVAMVRAMQEAGIECDIWKIEGFAKAKNYEAVIRQARNTPERADVSLIILGRNETKENVAKWINAGKNVPGVIGFAVGRTVFWNPLVEYRDGLITREEAAHKIATGFSEFCNLFLN
jgi:myo-inositol catabolism protein IolC